jgi:hypothetical protein
MATQASRFAIRARHALGGAACGLGIGLIAAVASTLIGDLHEPAQAGVMLGLSLFAGAIIGWLAG